MPKLREADLAGKRVLYRADYNVPLIDGVIQDDFRIKATFPTLDYLIEQGAKIIIASHLGRPDGKEVPELSLRPVAEVLADHYEGHTVHLAHKISHPEVVETIEQMQAGDILLLPNVRFFPGEEGNDEQFGRELAALAEVYVNDAFACDHRAHASIVAPPKYLPAYPGFLLDSELEHLGGLLQNPARPFVVVMGGAKVSDKIEVIKTLAAKADLVLIGGAMANTFLLAKGESIGDSKAEPDKLELAKELLDSLGEKLLLAPDFVAAGEGEHFKYLDIGPEATTLFKEKLSEAKLIFWNGSLGYAEEAPYDTATREIAEHIGTLKGVTSIVAGGDTVEMITSLQLHDRFTFVSTGGGAALEFLAGEELPGVVALWAGPDAGPDVVEEKVQAEAQSAPEKDQEEGKGETTKEPSA